MASAPMKFDYDVAMQCVGEFKAQFERAETLVADFKNTSDKASAPWEGMADSTFLSEIDTCMARLRHTPLLITQVADALKYAHDEFAKAEEAIKANTTNTIQDDTL